MSEENPKEEQEYKEELIAIFKEHWNHARHCENERIWFTNIYAIVVAAILVFIGNAIYGESADFGAAILLALFGLILSVIGFLIVVALSLGYLHHICDIVIVYYYWNKMEFYRHPGKPVRFGSAHRWFFEITIALFFVLIVLYSLQATVLPEPRFIHWLLLALLWIGFSKIIEEFYKRKWKKEYVDECIDFMKTLRNDTTRIYMHDWPNGLSDLREVIFGN